MKNRNDQAQILSEALDQVNGNLLQQAHDVDTAEKFHALRNKGPAPMMKDRPVTVFHRATAIAASLAVAVALAFGVTALVRNFPGIWGPNPTNSPMTNPPIATPTEPTDPTDGIDSIQPPRMYVSAGSETLSPMRLAYCWTYQLNGYEVTNQTDALKATEALNVPILNTDTASATLLCEVEPQVLTVRCWAIGASAESIVYENYEKIAVTDCEISLKTGSYLYEIYAEWTDVKGSYGNASYTFAATVNHNDPVPKEPNIPVGEVSLGTVVSTSCHCGECLNLKDYWVLHSPADAAAAIEGGISANCRLYETLNSISQNNDFFSERTMVFVFFTVPTDGHDYSLTGMEKLEDGSYVIDVDHTEDTSCVMLDQLHYIRIEVNGIMEEDAVINVRVNDAPMQDPNKPSGTCGENATWEFDPATGTLTISGTGEMDVDLEHIPWTDYQESITKLVVEPGITSVSGFVNCYCLTDVSLPETLQIITAIAFSQCTALTQVTIPDSVTHIQDGAFSHCNKLEKVSIGTGLSQLSERAFQESTRLQQISIHADNPNFFCDGTVIYTKYPRTVVLMAPGFTGEYTVLPETIEIGAFAFYRCRKLTSVILPDSVTCIGQNAFSGCHQLEWVRLSEKLQIISEQAFRGCYVLTELTIPASVTTIQASVFVNCEKLTKIVFLGDAPEIHEMAFSSVTAVVTYPADNPTWTADKRANYDGILIWVPDDPRAGPIGPSGSCGNNANWSFDAVTGTLTISGTGEMDEIEIAPWWDYSKLIKEVMIEYGITKIDGFSELHQLVSVEIPDSVTTIGEGAFYNCPLTSIHLPDSVTTIGAKAFSACSLTSIHLPNSVTSIGESAFSGCSSLKEINIPIGLTEISSNMLAFCSDLRTVSLHDGITTIGNQAFFWCVGLESIVLPDSVTYLGAHAFAGCSKLDSVTLSRNITSIPTCTFDRCTSLKEIKLPDSVTVIGAYAFYGCELLQQITLPSNVKTIEGHAFEGCRSLKSITFPASLESLGEYALYGIYAHQSICFSGNMPKFGENLFSIGHYNTITVYYPQDNNTWTQETIDALIQLYGTQLQFVAVDENGQPVNP